MFAARKVVGVVAATAALLLAVPAAAVGGPARLSAPPER